MPTHERTNDRDDLTIELDGGSPQLLGEDASGRVTLEVDEPCLLQSVRVFMTWSAGSEADSGIVFDVELLDAERSVAPDDRVAIPFTFAWPRGPASYDGDMFDVDWEIEARATFDDHQPRETRRPVSLAVDGEVDGYRPGVPARIGPDGVGYDREPLKWPAVLFLSIFVVGGLAATTAFPFWGVFLFSMLIIAGAGWFNISRSIDIPGLWADWPRPDRSYQPQIARLGLWFLALALVVPAVTVLAIVFAQSGELAGLWLPTIGLPFWAQLTRLVVVGAGLWLLYVSTRNSLAGWALGGPTVDVEPTRLHPGQSLTGQVEFEPRRTADLEWTTLQLRGFERKQRSSTSDYDSYHDRGGVTTWTTEIEEIYTDETRPDHLAARAVETGETAGAEATLQLPDDAPFSFQGRTTEFRWEFVVEVNKNGWGDWRRRVPLVVAPRGAEKVEAPETSRADAPRPAPAAAGTRPRGRREQQSEDEPWITTSTLLWAGGIFGGLLIVVALAGGAYGLYWYLRNVIVRTDGCVARSHGAREAPPSVCLEEYDSHDWVKPIPWAGDYFEWYRKQRVRPELFERELSYYSTYEPSREQRFETLTRIASFIDENDNVYDVESFVPERYLSSIDDELDSSRAEYLEWSIRTYSRVPRPNLEEAYHLAEFTRDDDSFSWVLDEALDSPSSDQPDSGCRECPMLDDIGLHACVTGRRKAGRQLLSAYGHAVGVSELDGAGKRADATEASPAIYRETRRDERLVARVGGDLCGDDGETPLTDWWRTDQGRRTVARVWGMAPPTRRLAALAHVAASEEGDLEQLRSFALEAFGDDEAPLDGDSPLETVAERANRALEERVDSPFRLLSAPILVRPSTYRTAAERLDELAEGATSHPLARALRLRGALAAAHFARRESAESFLEATQFQDDNPMLSFRAAIYRLFGEFDRTLELLDRAQSRADEDARLADLKLRRAVVLGASGTPERGLQMVGEIDFDALEKRGDAGTTKHAVGLGYALAFHAGGDPDDQLQKHLPAAFQPAELRGEWEDDTDYFLRQAIKLARTSGTERADLREVEAFPLPDASPWHVAALGAGVGADEDAEAWLDYASAPALVGRESAGQWVRAEAARWRGDDRAADAWMRRIRAAGEPVDGPRDLLLHELR